MKLFEQKYPESTNSDRQRQPQSRYSADCPVSQRTPQQRTATAQPSRQTVNNRTYTRQHIPQKRRTPKKRKQRRLLGISAAVLAIILLAVLIIVVAKSCSSGGDVPKGTDVLNGTDVLSGTWDLDGITVYQFDGKGNGALKLPDTCILDDKLKLLQDLFSKESVTGVSMSPCGDIFLQLSTLNVSAFCAGSTGNEMWRFFKTGTDKPHIICTGLGFETV